MIFLTNDRSFNLLYQREVKLINYYSTVQFTPSYVSLLSRIGRINSSRKEQRASEEPNISQPSRWLEEKKKLKPADPLVQYVQILSPHT